MDNKSKSSKKQAHFQSGHRQSSNFGKVDADKEVSPDGDGTIHFSEDEPKDIKEIRKTVDKLLEDTEEE